MHFHDQPVAENLFSYGTLQDPQIQLKTFGRILEGQPDSLSGYKLSSVKIKDKLVVAETGMTHYNNIIYTGVDSDLINGTVLQVSEDELKQADEYEALDNYQRTVLKLASGKIAWVYHYVDLQSAS